MSRNSFRFFRGTNHIFYEDIAYLSSLPPSPVAWLSGDLHLENFGTYKSDNRLVYFDLNDFDEAVLAPLCLELVRMVAGIVIAFDSVKIDPRKAQKMGHLFLNAYSRTLAAGKAAYVETRTANGILRNFLEAAESRKHKELLTNKTLHGTQGRQFSMEYPSHKRLPDEFRASVMEHVSKWLKEDDHSPYNYEAVDAVFRLTGAGSVGVERYAVLLKSLNTQGEKYLLLDMKEARQPSLPVQLLPAQPQWESEAERVVNIQRWMQNQSPALLSTTEYNDRSFVMEEMQSVEDKIDFKLVKHDYRGMYEAVNTMGILAASAQLRSSGRKGAVPADELIAFGQSDKWQATVLQQATDAAHQMLKYYLQFLKDDPARAFKKQLTHHLQVDRERA